MSTAIPNEPRIETVTVTEKAIAALLTDGKTISVPLACSWRLSEATRKERANWEIIATGRGVHWPDLDEDISLDGMLHGVPAKRSRQSVGARGNRAKEATLKGLIDAKYGPLAGSGR